MCHRHPHQARSGPFYLFIFEGLLLSVSNQNVFICLARPSYSSIWLADCSIYFIFVRSVVLLLFFFFVFVVLSLFFLFGLGALVLLLLLGKPQQSERKRTTLWRPVSFFVGKYSLI